MPAVVQDYVAGPTKAKGRGQRRKGASGELVVVSMSPVRRLPPPNKPTIALLGQQQQNRGWVLNRPRSKSTWSVELTVELTDAVTDDAFAFPALFNSLRFERLRPPAAIVVALLTVLVVCGGRILWCDRR